MKLYDFSNFSIDDYVRSNFSADEISYINVKTHGFWGLQADRCESPIEKILYVHLIKESPEDMGIFTQHEICAQDGIIRRLDFLIALMPPLHGYPKALFAIETDGKHHDEESYPLIDRKRDRSILRTGISTVRFSGKEVFNSASECATDVYFTFQSMKQNMMSGIFYVAEKEINIFSPEYQSELKAIKSLSKNK